MEVVKIDKKGRLLIPKKIREATGVGEGKFVKIEVREKSIIIEPLESVADKYFGAFRIEKWPKNLDEFMVEVMKEWWRQKVT
jgi:AbrB family looped-hinge helix DNA binding protein